MPRKMPAISVGRMRIPAAIGILLFGGLLAFGANSLDRVHDRLRRAEWWGRLATGAVFLLVGIYSSLRYIHEWI